MIGIVSYSSLGDRIEDNTTAVATFRIRNALQRAPKISPHVKIVAYGDESIALLKSPEPSLSDYGFLIESLEKIGVRSIIFDKVFGYSFENPAGVSSFASILRQYRNCFAGAFDWPFVINGRTPLELDGRFDITRFSSNNDSADLDKIPVEPAFLYGPMPELQNAFSNVGLINYHGGSFVNLMRRLKDQKLAVHLALLSAEKVVLDRSGLSIDNHAVALDRYNRTPVNFISPADFTRINFKYSYVLSKLKRGEPLSEIQRGDTVIIVPLFYSGNVDISDTPVGTLPRSIITASLVNSVVSGQWLTPVEDRWFFILLASTIGVVFALVAKPLVFWLGGILILALTFALAQVLFSFAGIMFPALYPMLALAFAGIHAHGRKMRLLDKKMTIMRETLKGSIPENKLTELLKRPDQIKREPTNHIVTLMFIDIANFSVMAEQRSPRDIFAQLKELLTLATQVIHAHGGTIDRSLGDGLLCYFGHSFDGTASHDKQADAAIRCAIELQHRNLEFCLASSAAGRPVLPARIGINTSSVYIGDLGTGERIDFTVIGSGVNYTQRLQNASDPFSIIISPTTIECSGEYNIHTLGFRKRYIPIKHYEGAFEVVECDPFFNAPDKKNQAVKLYRETVNLSRSEQRWPVLNDQDFVVESDYGRLRLMDFSLHGLRFSLPTYLGRGITVTCGFDTLDGRLKKTLAASGISLVRYEIRWGHPVGDQFVHGGQIVNLAERELEMLFSALRQFSAQVVPPTSISTMPKAGPSGA